MVDRPADAIGQRQLVLSAAVSGPDEEPRKPLRPNCKALGEHQQALRQVVALGVRTRRDQRMKPPTETPRVRKPDTRLRAQLVRDRQTIDQGAFTTRCGGVIRVHFGQSPNVRLAIVVFHARPDVVGHARRQWLRLSAVDAGKRRAIDPSAHHGIQDEAVDAPRGRLDGVDRRQVNRADGLVQRCRVRVHEASNQG